MNPPIYETTAGYDDPSTFHVNHTFQHNFATNTYHFLHSEADEMSQFGPTTPLSLEGARGAYAGMPGDLTTPQGMQYAGHGMYQTHTPVAPTWFGGHSALQAPQATASNYDFGPYDRDNDASSSPGYGAIGTPTPKPRGTSTSTPMPSPPVFHFPQVSQPYLQYNNFSEAEAEASGRTPLNVDNDDWHWIESNKKLHVAAIMAAFDVPFRPEPNVPLTVTEKLRWVKYQTEQCDKVAKYAAKNPSAKEVSAWMLLEALLDTHKLGYKKGLRVADASIRCSERLALMIKAIGRYAVIRFDLVRMLRFEDLATSPSHVVSRKVANWRGNAGKVKRDELNKEFAAAAGVEYKNVLGDKRKYKKAVVEGNEDTSGMETPPLVQTGDFKRKYESNDVDRDTTPATPSKSGRKAAEPATTAANKRAKRTTVVAGPDADI